VQNKIQTVYYSPIKVLEHTKFAFIHYRSNDNIDIKQQYFIQDASIANNPTNTIIIIIPLLCSNNKNTKKINKKHY
jgi:hypothetical protein